MDIELDESDELEVVDIPPPTLLLAVAELGLIDKTCCVCWEELANWSDILGELDMLVPPPPDPPLDAELPACVVVVPAVLPL